MNPWGGQDEQSSLFSIRKSLDGELTNEYVDKEQFIGVKIGKEEFLLTISVVSEIIMLPVITFVPNGPKYVEGVVNLRGTILPVINIRKMMGLSKCNVTSTTRIIICKDDSVAFKVGLLVDAITFVVSLVPDEIVRQSLPSNTGETELISAVSKSGSTVKGIIELGKILAVAADGKSILEDENKSAEDAA